MNEYNTHHYKKGKKEAFYYRKWVLFLCVEGNVYLTVMITESEMHLHGKGSSHGLSNWSLLVNPLTYFSFQPVLYSWYNKGHGMYYPNDMEHIGSLLIRKNSSSSGSNGLCLLIC